jgi:hypothetical protein
VIGHRGKTRRGEIGGDLGQRRRADPAGPHGAKLAVLAVLEPETAVRRDLDPLEPGRRVRRDARGRWVSLGERYQGKAFAVVGLESGKDMVDAERFIGMVLESKVSEDALADSVRPDEIATWTAIRPPTRTRSVTAPSA